MPHFLGIPEWQSETLSFGGKASTFSCKLAMEMLIGTNNSSKENPK